ncbi:helicase associated domain-containing protein [Arthrobacter sp. IK3]|uniref:helicase associated domain-containing protein n=1 Tax=Arthrobacter sp. IK3 TaxID=3448169 RepID=UPI003EE3F480
MTETLRAGSHNDRQWARTLEELASFRAEHDSLPGDSGRTPRERPLQQWLKRQIRLEADGLLRRDRIEALDAVDGDWRANQSRLSWEGRLAEAILEYQTLGRVPGNGEGSDPWLLKQRSRLSAGKLSEDQVEALDEAIPGWRNLDRIKWSERARELRRHVDATGSLPTSRTKDPEAYRCYTWLAFQRKKLRQGRLDAAQLAELDGLVPGWRGRSAD